ncbi:MAG: alpha/beta fold hydrolase [Thermoflexales bacterium]|nr:alpha/beta fold hydrolase [Thermoflexales bacterium]
MSSSDWPYRYRPARGYPRGLLVLLHGYGSNESDLYGLIPFLDERLQVVSLRAPIRLADEAFAWFDLEFRPDGIQANPEDIQSAVQAALPRVHQAINLTETPAEQTFLLGFSQGAMLGAAILATQPSLVRGAVLLSGAPPEGVQVFGMPLAASPVFVAHGTFDAVIPVSRGRKLSQWLSALGAKVTYCEYPVAHALDENMLEDVDRWLSEQLSAP